jgi:hypothetical protein
MPSWTSSIPSVGIDAVTAAFDNAGIVAANWRLLATAGRPAALPEGGIFVDGSDVAFDALRVYADLKGTGAADYEVGQVHRERVEMLGATRATRELQQACVQLRASHPTPAAELQGHPYELTGDGRLYVVADLGGATYARRTILTAGSADLISRATLPAGSWLADLTNAPALGEKGEAAGWRFTATTQKLRVRVFVPLGWDSGADPTVRISSVLDATGTAGDDLHWLASYKCLEPNASALASAALEAASVAHDLGSSVDEYAVCRSSITLDRTKLVAGRELLLVLSVPTYGGAGNVGSRLFLGAEILWPTGARISEE